MTEKVNELINDIYNKNYNAADTVFQQVMNDKIAYQLAQQKEIIAKSLFNSQNTEQE